MTHEEMIAVIQAHKEGKAIEVTGAGIDEWTVANSPLWDFNKYRYRVKRAPREIYLSERGGVFDSGLYKTRREAIAFGAKAVKFIEVIE